MIQKVIILVIIVVIILLGGVWFAFLLPQKDTGDVLKSTTGTSSEPVFSDLRIGTLVRASFANQKNPPIKQKTEYTVNEQLMLRSTTTSRVEEPVSVTVRLIDEKSRIVSLSPSQVTLEPGTGSYCCWTIPTPGQYTMQIFRPDSLITSIPLKITRDLSSINSATKQGFEQ